MREILRKHFRGGLSIEEISDHSVLIDEVGRNTIVLDLGANHGRFSGALADIKGCQCYLVEANPSLATELAKQSFAGVLQAAASGRCEKLGFRVEACDLQSRVVEAGMGTPSMPVTGLDYSAILAHFGLHRVDLLKLDIEGSEIEFIDAMSDAQLTTIGQIAVEFHDFIPLYSRSEVRRILQRLRKLGFCNMSPNYGTYDVLLVNRHRVKVATLWHRLYASCCTRPSLRLLRQRKAAQEAHNARLV
jgi:FkbM family methyltransferase